MEQIFSTSQVRRSEKFEYWADAVCASYVELGCETETPSEFDGAIQLNRMSRLATSIVSGTRQTVNRRKSDIAHSLNDSFLVSLQLKEQCLIQQGGRSTLINVGDFALYNSAEPYTLTLSEGFEQLVIQVPREELLCRLPNADMLTGRSVSANSPVGNLVAGSLPKFAKFCGDQQGAVSDNLQHTIVDLLVTGFAALDGSNVLLRRPEQQLLFRANHLIQSSFMDPDFDRNKLAKALGISVRRLGEIFKLQDTSISASIKECRLQAIADRLQNRKYQRYSISEIALGCGVNNLQHFSKSFRKRFGMTPTMYRCLGPGGASH